MVIKITNIEENNNILKFNISNINVSYVNAIRRIILSDIPCAVFLTYPYEKNLVNIEINTSRLNNELLKQRIGCIPIYLNILDNKINVEDYLIELHVKNTSNTIIYATTKDFKIKDLKMQKYLSESIVREIFPPDNITGDFIDIVRLRPSIYDSVESGKYEEIKLDAKLSIGMAKENGMYNVVSTCSYGNTVDNIKVKEEWNKKYEELKKIHTSEEINKLQNDFMYLESKRLYIPNCFDFIVESIGIYNNFKIIELACSILIKKLYKIIQDIKENSDNIKEINDTMENCYIITILDEDYTVGKILDNELFNNYYNDKKLLTFNGFIKYHPHDKDSYIKLAFKDITNINDIINIIDECVNNSILKINTIKQYFTMD
jgi:DNA-directed RNA polymerase subunit L